MLQTIESELLHLEENYQEMVMEVMVDIEATDMDIIIMVPDITS
jgi:hypothetical protein